MEEQCMSVWLENDLEPLDEKKPDFEQFRDTLMSRKPGPVPFGDLFADPGIMSTVLGEKVKRPDRVREGDQGLDAEVLTEGVRFLEQCVRFSEIVGWDFVSSHSLLGFPGFRLQLPDKSSVRSGGERRAYIDSEGGPIMSWQDFENYRWPESPGTINSGSKYLAEIVPEGMKVLVLPGGLFEWATWLMGLVPFSYALYDQPDLVDALLEKLSDIIYTGAEELMSIPNIGGLFIGDDMGFFSGPLVSPKILREKFLPHLKNMVDLGHRAGKLVILHSCGNLEAVMDDICDTGVDGKHSFEDKIMPVEEVYRRWGDRISILGGVDVNLLTSGTEDQVRCRTREILDVCGTGGGYVLGTGNSVASYIKIKNYLAMLDEGRKWNLELYGRGY